MRKFWILGAIVAIGCAKPAEQPPVAQATPPPQSAEGGIAPVGSGALGGAAPVTGSESVEGAGMGGIGQVAKNKARSVAAGAGAPAGSQSTAGSDDPNSGATTSN